MNETQDPLVLRRATVNPYRIATSMLLGRLLWDMRPQSWVSRHRLRQWKDRYQGQRAVILCNGPSLLDVDFDKLHGVFTFGLNKINLLFDKTDFRPSCIVSVNPFVIEQNSDFFNHTSIPLFLASRALGSVRPRDNVIFFHSIGTRTFAKDCSISLYEGYTVTAVALQLAFHFGFNDVALVGADHNFAASGPANATVVSTERDDSHFDPNYFAGGVKWQLPDLFESEVSYTMAKHMFEAHGRRVVNATNGGKLEVFTRLDLDAFLHRPAAASSGPRS
jgi:hypothetical protein